MTVSKTKDKVVPINCGPLDKLLEGGIPINGLSLIYGEAATGKTTLAIQCAVNVARQGDKTIFIDGDNAFPPKRLAQIAGYELDRIAPQITLMRPKTFQEQGTIIDHLEGYLEGRVCLVIIDTVTSLYRIELGFSEENFIINRELNRQIACLAQLTKRYRIAALIISQVRSILSGDRIGIEPVASRVLRFWSDVIISLERIGNNRIIKAEVEKHPETRNHNSCYIAIENKGVSKHK